MDLQMLYIQLLQKHPKLVVLCSILGFLVICSKAIRTLLFIYRNFLRRKRNLISRYGAGSWAFVTGSSDGIGRAIAHSLAKRGFNIVLAARTESKLKKVQQQLTQINESIQSKYIVVDFSESARPGFFDRIANQLNDIDVSILVNNVGVDVLSPYVELSEDEISRLITINCFPVAILTRKFLPKMITRKNKSAIVNVASVAGQLPMPLHNVYSASKAFVDFFSRSLNYEHPNIDIISLRPSEVSTPMTFNKKKDILTIGPEDCAQGLMNDLSYDVVTHGPISHKLQSYLYSIIPEGVFNFFWKNYIGPDFIRERKAAQHRTN